MIKRTLMFTTPKSLSLRNSQIVITDQIDSSQNTTIPLEDVGIVLVENPQVHISIPLINEMVDNGIVIILCNKKSMPNAVIRGLDVHNLQGEILRLQVAATPTQKKRLWQQIIKSKIKNQGNMLNKLGLDGKALLRVVGDVLSGDSSNREGYAARLYWELLFGRSFVRDRNIDGVNILLNYGYSILRAATVRAIVSSGLNPSFGLYHHNRSNPFPLADDLMEPYRPFVDEIVYNLFENGYHELTTETKSELVKSLYSDTKFSKYTRPLCVGMSFTTASLAKCLSKQGATLSLPDVP